MNKLITSFTFVILISFIVVQPALSQSNDTVNLLDHPCSISVGKSDIGEHTTKACLELVKEFESKNIINEDYLIALFYLETSALLTADYGIADQTFEKSMEYIENNKVKDPTLEMLIIDSYTHYLVLHKDENFAKKLILKYLPKFKNTKVEKNKKHQQGISIVSLEKNLAHIYLGQVDTNKKELQDAKIILENHLNIALPLIEDMWIKAGVDSSNIYNARSRTLLLYGDLLRRLGNTKEGLNYKIKALNLVKSKMPLKQHAWVYQDIGIYYHIWLKDYDKAIDYYKKAIHIFENDPLLTKELIYLVTLDGIASSYWFLDQFEQGYEYSKKAADLSLERLYGQVDANRLLSVPEELEKTKNRIDTHIDNIFRIYFSPKEKKQSQLRSLVTESVYYGQLLPQLKTAEALSYLQSNMQSQNIELKDLIQKKLLLEEELSKLQTLRDDLRIQDTIDYDRLNKTNETIHKIKALIDDIIKAVQSQNPFFTRFNLEPVTIDEIMLMFRRRRSTHILLSTI